MKPLQRIAVVGNATKAGAGEIADRLANLAKSEGLEVELTMTFPPRRICLRRWMRVLSWEAMAPYSI